MKIQLYLGGLSFFSLALLVRLATYGACLLVLRDGEELRG